DDTKTIGDLQERFTLCFPQLKIEFYHKRHHWQEDSAENLKIDSQLLIGNIRKIHEPGVLEIKSWHKTGEVEQNFKNLFGLNVQVFYRDHHHWKQSILSDNKTLAMLSEQYPGHDHS
ncbi:MAG: hypothetical protein ACXWCR_15410, partial [Flavitalea sp.]